LTVEQIRIKSPKYEETMREGFCVLKQGGKMLRLTELFKQTWSYLEL